MIKPKRMQRRRIKGYNMQAESLALNGLPAVYMGRPSKFRNMCKVGVDVQTREQAVFHFRRNVLHDEKYCEMVRQELRGKNLACWCPLIVNNKYCPCHADVLISIANNMTMEEVKNENLGGAKREAAK